jgi:predicted nucleic acid-binding protein
MASDPVFLDTGGWIALLNASDSLHAAATTAWQQIVRERRPILTTDYIVAETGNGLARTAARHRFPRAVDLLRRSPLVTVVDVDEPLLSRGLMLYASRHDKQWGLVDCVSFVVMQDRQITNALASDRHYEQAGVRCLLPL